VIAALISPWLTPDTNSLKDWMFITMAFLGTGLILWSGKADGLELDAGHIAGLGAALFMGLTLTLIRRISAVNTPLTPIFYISVLGMVVSIFPMVHPNVGLAVPALGLAWIVAIGLFAVLAHIATNKALTFIASAKVGSISMLEVVFGALYGYILFSESLGWSTLGGGIFVLAACFGLAQSDTQIPTKER
jgi:drug/metabolite transporter (DMT)-like permease